MLSELLGWWIGQLADCIPTRWRRGGPSEQDRVTVAPAGQLGFELSTVSISIWAKNRETPIGQFRATAQELARVPMPAGLPVALRLFDADVLSKTITLPLATERDLAQVLSFEMDRETPFAVDEVFWSYRIIERDKRRGQLAVRLRLVGRALLGPLLDSLAEAGILVRRAEIAGGVDDGFALPLQPDTTRLERGAGARLLGWASIAACAALAMIVVAAPFIRQGRDIAQLDEEIAAGRGAAAQAEQLRREIERLEGAGDAVVKERAEQGEPLAMLAALTAALPDDTYLTELQQQQHKVTFGGRSAAASRLIAAVSKTSELRNPAFIAPVTRMESTHTEVFSISAETGP